MEAHGDSGTGLFWLANLCTVATKTIWFGSPQNVPFRPQDRAGVSDPTVPLHTDVTALQTASRERRMWPRGVCHSEYCVAPKKPKTGQFFFLNSGKKHQKKTKHLPSSTELRRYIWSFPLQAKSRLLLVAHHLISKRQHTVLGLCHELHIVNN